MAKIDWAALRQKIQQLEGLTDEERSALMELTATKRYGLVWEEREEAVEERLREELPVLVEDESLRIENGSGPNHILIEGDNLEALTALSYTHEGKVDVIYIDPPYNTGNKDFVYNDSFVDSEDSYRHSKWLSFMSKRLRIAKRLLSDRGVIFISIDDNEQANLKLLCDEVFGEIHYVACIAWQRTYSTRNDSKGVPKEVESILVYSKQSEWTPRKLPRTEKMNSLYKSPDNDPRIWTSSSVSAPGAATHQGMVYAIQHPFTGEMMYPTVGRCWSLGQEYMLENLNKWCKYKLENIYDEEIRAKICGVDINEIRDNVMGIVLAESLEISKLKAQAVLTKGCWPYFYFTNNGKGGLRRKTYLDDMEGRVVTNFFSYDECGHTDEAKKEIMSLLDGKSKFDTPKPVRLIYRILQISSMDNSTILDFFAGSGTALHAVMQLNKEDGGKRQCILVTNNENNICRDVTYERNRRVIEGYTTPKGVQVEGLEENNLRYYRIQSLPRERTNRNMRALVAAATDLLCIKEGIYDELKIENGNSKIAPRYARFFNKGDKRMLIIYDERVIPYVVDWLEHADSSYGCISRAHAKIKVYVFSPGAYAWDDDFAPVIDRVELCALPEAIYQAYKNVLPPKKRQSIEIETAKKGDEQ